MTPEQLERAITHYLDGTLPPEEVAALEQLLASDPAARALRDEHERLTALLRENPLPEMDWADLAADFSAVVTGSVSEHSRLEDQKLNALLKSATPLPALQWDKVANQISASIDAELTVADAEDARLDELLQSAPLPALNWDRLAAHLSGVVAAETAAEAPILRITPAPTPAKSDASAVAGRIGFARTFRRLALAACLAIAAAVGIKVVNNSGTPTPSNPVGPGGAVAQGKPVVEIEAPTVELASKPAVTEIEIGASKSYAATSDPSLFNRPAVVIAVPARPATDEDPEAYAFD